MTILQNEYAKAQTISIYIWKIKKRIWNKCIFKQDGKKKKGNNN